MAQKENWGGVLTPVLLCVYMHVCMCVLTLCESMFQTTQDMLSVTPLFYQ